MIMIMTMNMMAVYVGFVSPNALDYFFFFQISYLNRRVW